jgi:hypothetical protein
MEHGWNLKPFLHIKKIQRIRNTNNKNQNKEPSTQIPPNNKVIGKKNTQAT